MLFDELEQDQDKAAMQPWRFGYPLPNEEEGENTETFPMAPPQAQPDAPGPQPEPRPSVGQRIMQIGSQGIPPFDIQDGRPVWRQDPQTPQKLSIGQRIMQASSELPSVRVSSASPTPSSFSLPQEEKGIFSSFIPGGTTPSISESSNSQTQQREPGNDKALGRPVAEAAGAMAGAASGAGQMLNPFTPIVDATNQMRTRSRIPRPTATPDVSPNLLIGDSKGVPTTLAGLMRGIPDDGRAVELQSPLGINADPDVIRHMLPDNAGTELRELVKPQRWQAVPDADKAKLAELMGQDMVAANEYAKALLTGKPRPEVGTRGVERYFGPEVDNLVHSSAWVDGRLKPEEKAALARLIKENDVDGATAFVRQLYRRFWYESRYPRWAGTVAGRLSQAGKIAEAYQYNKQWMVETAKVLGKNEDKCNEFVADVLEEAGLESPRRHGGYGGVIAASEWADTSRQRVGHWQIVNGPPQPGDVIAELTGGRDHPNWAHTGVVVGPGRTASASTLVYPKGMIVVNDWGFRKDDLEKRVVRRYVP